MQFVYSLIFTGVLLSSLPLHSENTELAPSLTIQEEAPAAASNLSEELSILDKEFEEFKEELFSLESQLQKEAEQTPTIVENLQETMNPVIEEAVAQENLTPTEEKVLAPVVLDIPAMQFFSESQPKITEIASETPAVVEESAQEVIPTLTVSFDAEEADEKEEVVEMPTLTVLENALVPETVATHVTTETITPIIAEPASTKNTPIAVDLKQAFEAAPIIYSLLLGMSIFAVGIWLYCLLSLRVGARLPRALLKAVQNKLSSNSFEEALALCEEHNTLFSKMIATGITARRHGLPVMIESMKSEGKRNTVALWQKIGLLNDIAIIAPMLGLLGTVLGMFYAFYDVNRSIESISSLFDGLGVSVGTTVAGLVVAILALLLQSTAKYRIVRALAQVENEAQSMATLMEDRTAIYKGNPT